MKPDQEVRPTDALQATSAPPVLESFVMALISCQRLSITFGGPYLLEDANLQIERGERIGLLGRNGEGKSTLLNIILGTVAPDAGEVVRDAAVRVSLVEQQIPEGLPGSALEVIKSGSFPATEDHHAERLCSLLHLDPYQSFSSLSGGQKRRALLGKALVCDPDVLPQPTKLALTNNTFEADKAAVTSHLTAARAGAKAIRECGAALARIQASEGWKNESPTFERFVQDNWQISIRTAYRFIEHAKILGAPQLAREQPILTNDDDNQKAKAGGLARHEAKSEAREVTVTDTQRATRAVRTLVGCEPPPNVVQAILDGVKLAEVRDEIQGIRKRLKGIAETPLGTFLTRGSLDIDLRNAREAIKFAMPACACVYCAGKGCDGCAQTGWLPIGKFKQAEKYDPELVKDAREAGLIP